MEIIVLEKIERQACRPLVSQSPHVPLDHMPWGDHALGEEQALCYLEALAQKERLGIYLYTPNLS